MASSSDLGLAALEFGIKVIGSVVLGSSIGIAIYGAGRIGKNRSRTAGIVCGLVCGLAACAVILVVSGGSGIGPLSGAVILCGVGLIPGAGGLAGSEEPFCELHNNFMEERVIRQISLTAEADAIRLLMTSDFAGLAELPSTDDHHNSSKVTLFHCRECREGYISMTTTVSARKRHSDGSSISESESRLVYSSALNPPQVASVLNGQT
jgi:hypothetical protein